MGVLSDTGCSGNGVPGSGNSALVCGGGARQYTSVSLYLMLKRDFFQFKRAVRGAAVAPAAAEVLAVPVVGQVSSPRVLSLLSGQQEAFRSVSRQPGANPAGAKPVLSVLILSGSC